MLNTVLRPSLPLEWLCDFTSVVGREEAAEMAAQFVRFGLITLVSDKRKNNDSTIIFTVRGSAPGEIRWLACVDYVRFVLIPYHLICFVFYFILLLHSNMENSVAPLKQFIGSLMKDVLLPNGMKMKHLKARAPIFLGAPWKIARRILGYRV